jgi:hypothetical protein
MKPPGNRERDRFLVAQLATAISIISFFYYLQHGDLLLYGDAVAHINIARRVFDSRTPGLLQLGTVWLPLPHLLMIPFLLSHRMWVSGMAGSIPSLIAYVLSAVGMVRLVEAVLPAEQAERRDGRYLAWLAAGIFLLNPNLIYLQSTAMTEPIYLLFFIWASVFFSEALASSRQGKVSNANSALMKCGFCLLGASSTRYDGWLLSALIVGIWALLAYVGNFRALRPGVTKLALLAAAGPALWLGYNQAVYRNAWEFSNGPYSAKAIELKSGAPQHPGMKDLPVAFRYFLKSAELNLAPGKLQGFWVTALLLGTAIVLLFQRQLWPFVLLWTPVPFYMLSIAYGGVPIFVPTWWPFSLYNVRYGIEMLPAFAIFTAAAAYGLMRFAAGWKGRTLVAVIFPALTAISYAQVLLAAPISFKEAVVNSRTRVALEKQLASIISTLPENSTFLMYLGDHVGTFQRAGIPLSHVINEGNHRPWKRPTDPQGLWERALADPAKYADFVIAFDRDPVASAANASEMVSLLVLHVTGQPPAIIYRTRKSNQPR